MRLAPWAEQVISDAQRPDFHLHVGGPDVQVKWKSSGPRPMTSHVYGTQGPLKERRSTNPPPSPGRLPGATEGPQARTRPPPAAVNADPPSRIVSVASWSRVRFLLRSCVFQIWRFIVLRPRASKWAFLRPPRAVVFRGWRFYLADDPARGLTIRRIHLGGCARDAVRALSLILHPDSPQYGASM